MAQIIKIFEKQTRRKTHRHDLNSRFLRCRGAALADDAATLASSISHPLDELI